MEPARQRFRHEAFLYEDADGFVAGTAGFVREGLDAGESVLVAVVEERADPLREELGADAALVEFLDMARVGRNPGRIIPVWRDLVQRNRALGTGFRGVGEPVWVGRSALELRECRTHEHLLNTAFDAGPAWRLLCPYDAVRLPRPVLEDVVGAHPELSGAPAPENSATFDPQAGFAAFAEPLPELGPALFAADFGFEELSELRAAVRERAGLLGLDGRATADFVLVADELASNSVRHGGGRGRLALWRIGEHAVCEVRDSGLIVDPLVGRRRPDLLSPGGSGAGLWTANRLCDLLLIHSTPAAGTAVRAYLPLPSLVPLPPPLPARADD
jgi:anti-sigma regulatory factor (Ser/Thr protein kinase)